MQDTSNLIELVSGYEAYTQADELDASAATDAPGTTPACLWWSIGFVFGGSTQTIIRNC